LSAVCVVAPNLLGISRLPAAVSIADPIAEPAVARSGR
jgi:hypothetical protein